MSGDKYLRTDDNGVVQFVDITAESVGALSLNGGTINNGNLVITGDILDGTGNLTVQNSVFVNHNVSINGSIESAGSISNIVYSTGGTLSILPVHDAIYRYYPQQGDIIYFEDNEFMAVPQFTMQINQGETAVSFSFGSQIFWKTGIPDFSSANTTYNVTFKNFGAFEGGIEGWVTPNMSEYIKNSGENMISNTWSLRVPNVYQCRMMDVAIVGSNAYRLTIGGTYGGNYNQQAYYTIITGWQSIALYSKNNNIQYNNHNQNTKGGFCISDATTGNITSPGDVIASVSGGTVSLSNVNSSKMNSTNPTGTGYFLFGGTTSTDSTEMKGYYYKYFDLSGLDNDGTSFILYLSNNQCTYAQGVANQQQTAESMYDSSFNCEYAVDDWINMVNNTKQSHCAKISAIDHNKITFSNVDNSLKALLKGESSYAVVNGWSDNGDGANQSLLQYCITCTLKYNIGSHILNTFGVVIGSHNQCKSVGLYSFVTGRTNYAAGNYSVSFGRNNVSDGYASFTNGINNSAYGNYSHAEGNTTIAAGDRSHSQGHHTTAYGFSAHAEGNTTQANGPYAHAEGANANSAGTYSHAQGANTYAGPEEGRISDTAEASHAQGKTTRSTGVASHAEGYGTYANGTYGHAEGNLSRAIGHTSHAEGTNTYAGPKPGENQDTAQGAHSEGRNTFAYGVASHAQGAGTIAYTYAQHVEGSYNEIDETGQYIHIIGGGNGDQRRNIHTLDWNGNARFAGDVSATINGNTVGLSDVWIQPISDSSTTLAAINVVAGKKYKFSRLTQLALNSVENSDKESSIIFDSNEIPTILSAPASLKWFDGRIPQIESNYTYCISIQNNLAVIAKFGVR